MSRMCFVIRGESYILLRAAADSFSLEIGQLEEAYDLGLLGEGERVEDALAIAVAMLDRVALIRRLLVYEGINLVGIARILGPSESCAGYAAIDDELGGAGGDEA